ncbi:penicillin-binding transpeptidase domain-containing protein [Streptomyces griseoincarnatus]|uniref:Penicillin-binding transpeptidase domain-containing protein n=2 Tax=Streptomyces TaxID=1883 RepID=A0ABT0VSI5_STRGI|nr:MULTISPECIES: penicillin-binding transpeptidase domain-containing protein [Streptomyces]MBJ6616208.1 penicillin-binding protein [Streptomyces sp. I3(2020)]MBJ6626834.1 penicillin-binding protein [Streptomyces sp. I4(2020)]MCM2514327.1 penicillin-binding transpeptidase domain-containing protein [Streptomyces griseoincarnatus]
MGNRGRAGDRRNMRPVVIGAAMVVLTGGAGYGAYALVEGAGRDGGDSASQAETVKSGPLTADEVTAAAETFLTAWQSGQVAEAAAATDDPVAAKAALASYVKDARVRDLALTPGAPARDSVTFALKGTVSYEQTTKPLTYDSTLTVVRRAGDGEPRVDWRPSVLHPELREGDKLVTGEAGTPPVKALDRDGGELTTEKYPSLGSVLDGLREKYGEKAGGEAGVELRVVRGGASKKAELADTTLLELSEGTPGTVKTTLSPSLQALAEAEVAKRKRASVVVVRPSTGEILAAANSSRGFNVAFQGSLAPGSTMKVVTSSMMIEKGLASIDKKHPCPKYFSYGGWKFQNLDKFQIKDGTFRASFAASCNTAFISQAPKLEDDDLTQHAQDYFGLGRNDWKVGVSTFDGAVPVQSKAPMAASLIGQGGVRMNPLNMASVSATVKAGVFHQPYLVSPEVDGRQLATAPRTLSADTLAQLRELMSYTATAGTATEAMAGVDGERGAKTGSAEVDGQKKPNGWFTAYRGDLAAAAVVQSAGHGGSTAGPVVATLLKAGG